MGKYTSLARKTRETGPQKKCVEEEKDNTYKHTILVDTDSSPASPGTPNLPNLTPTPLRPYAVNAVIRCIHGTISDKCAVCSGYVRWLIEDEARLRAAQTNPEAARRQFAEEMKGEIRL